MQSHYDTALAETYQGDPPSFIWLACEILYHSSFCSELHLKTYSCINHHTHTWVSRKMGTIDAVIIFQIKNHVIVVLNELIALSNDHIDNFSLFAFNKYPAIRIIQFKAIFQYQEKLIFPHCEYVFSEDFILALPLSSALWLNSLSKKMRTSLRYISNRAQRTFTHLQFRYVPTSEITPALVQRVMAMSRIRVQSKGKKFGLCEREEQCLIILMQKKGEMFLLEKDGEIIAGLLCTYCEKDLFFHIIGHDSAVDDMRAGLLCCYHTILLAIENKYERIHFLWGRYRYKIQLGAKEEKLIKLAVFRKNKYKFIYPFFYFQKLFHQLKKILKQSRLHFFRG